MAQCEGWKAFKRVAFEWIHVNVKFHPEKKENLKKIFFFFVFFKIVFFFLWLNKTTKRWVKRDFWAMWMTSSSVFEFKTKASLYGATKIAGFGDKEGDGRGGKGKMEEALKKSARMCRVPSKWRNVFELILRSTDFV